jgi:hypothetical protein
VKFDACGFPLPTFNLVFFHHRQQNTDRPRYQLEDPLTLKSFAFSFFFLLLDPILTLELYLPLVTHDFKGDAQKSFEVCNRSTPVR